VTTRLESAVHFINKLYLNVHFKKNNVLTTVKKWTETILCHKIDGPWMLFLLSAGDFYI
jgi:hypothetical protein